MIIQRLWHQSRWRLTMIFAVIFIAMSAILGNYVNNACQRASADYTALISDIMLAQQSIPQPRLPTTARNHQANIQHIENIGHFFSVSKKHLDDIKNNIEHHRFLNANVIALSNHFNELHNRFSRLNLVVQAAPSRPELIQTLQHSAIELNNKQEWLYSELLYELQGLSQQQRLAMQRLSISMSVLLVLVFSAAITLCMAVLHLRHQRNLMQKLMLTDELTGLYNRRHLVNVALAALTQAQRDKTPLSLLVLDIDYFKSINDNYGHPTGDEVLRQISGRLGNLSRPSDIFARIGGEEFCLLMPNTYTYDALQVADRFRLEIENMQFEGIATGVSLTISIGVTTGTGDEHTFEQLYSFADKALYAAKTNGRNRVESILPPISHPASTLDEKNYFHQLMSQSSDS